MEIRTVPIRLSLHRHTFVLGAERELVMTAALIALLVGVGGMTLLSAGVALIFWIVAVFVLRRMARADPLMSRVWMRHVKQHDIYTAKSSRWRPLPGYKVK